MDICVGFTIADHGKQFWSTPIIPSLGVSDRFLKVYVIPLKHIKMSCLKPMSINNTLI
jgi:hypothetical protein